MSATEGGSVHDKKCADQEGYKFPVGSKLWQDTGFQGYQPEGAETHQPKKKPRGGELTAEEKASNREIGKERIGVEHSLSGLKRFHIISHIFRNFKDGFVDVVLETVCGSFNFFRSCRLETA